MYRGLADKFEAKTGIHVEITPLAWGNYVTKYFASMAAGLPPDIGVTNLGGPFDYGSVGGIVNLREAFPEQIAELESRFPAKLLPQYTIGDGLYGLPADLSTQVVYYRSDIFEQLGLRPPKTWSEMDRVIDVLEANGYRFFYGWTWGSQWALGLYTLPFGVTGQTMDSEGLPQIHWNEPVYQKAVFEAMKQWHTHDSPGKDLGSRLVGMFRSNQKGTALPMFVELHFNATQIEINAPELKGKWDVAPWPKADDGEAYNVMGGTTYVIFRKSKHKAEAFEWLKYLNTLEAQQFMILHRLNRGDESTLPISPLKSVWGPENDAFWQRPELERARKIQQVVAQVYPTFRTVAAIQGSIEVGRMEQNMLDAMGTFIRERQEAIASRHGMRYAQAIQAMAAGKLPEERERLYADIRAKLKREYEAIAPKALAQMQTDIEKYEERFGRIVRDLPKYEARTSILDVLKLAALFLVGAALFAVGLVPKLRRHVASYAFVAPPLVLALVFVFVPAVTALYLSFTEYHPVLPLSTARWTGLQNYGDAVHSGDLTLSLLRTAKYALMTVPLGIVIALFFAYLLSNRPRGETVWRFLYFSPLVTSIVSISLIFSQLFLGGEQGWLNAALLKMGLIPDAIPFLTSEKTFLNCVIVVAIWQGLAFTILVFVAGLQQIPAALFEAAAVDGAGTIRRFFNIALPGLRPQLLFVSVLGLIGAFQVFETIYTLANKSGDAGARFGPNDSAMTLVPLIYHTGFETFEMGKSSAIAYILFALILALTVVQIRFYRRGGAPG